MKEHPRVLADRHEGLRLEESRMQQARIEFADQMRMKKQRELAKKALADVDRVLKQRKQAMKQKDKVMTALAATRAYTMESLGANHRNGGSKQHVKNRHRVLDQVLEVGELSARQTEHWSFFKSAWDTAMAAVHKENWATYFAEMVHRVLQELLAGKTDALSVFVENEKTRVLGHVPALVVPSLESG